MKLIKILIIKYVFSFQNKMPLTNVSAVGLVGVLRLNLPIQTAGLFVLGVIVPIPQRAGTLAVIQLLCYQS